MDVLFYFIVYILFYLFTGISAQLCVFQQSFINQRAMSEILNGLIFSLHKRKASSERNICMFTYIVIFNEGKE